MKTSSFPKILGSDLGDKKHPVCVLGGDGKILDESTVANPREAMARLSKKHPGKLVVMEVGMQSPWVSRFFAGPGHRVLVANPRKVRAIYQNDGKCDRKDAVMPARPARADESLLCPVQHGTEQARQDLLQIKLRDNLVRQRVDVISAVRFTLKSLGIRLRSPNTACFARHARKELKAGHATTLAIIERSLVEVPPFGERPDQNVHHAMTTDASRRGEECEWKPESHVSPAYRSGAAPPTPRLWRAGAPHPAERMPARPHDLAPPVPRGTGLHLANPSLPTAAKPRLEVNLKFNLTAFS